MKATGIAYRYDFETAVVYYTIEANDAVGIVSHVDLEIPDDRFTSDEIAGSGDLRANIPMAAVPSSGFGDWTATVTMEYSLGDTPGTKTDTITMSPDSFYCSRVYYTTVTEADNGSIVKMTLGTWVDPDDPLTYTVDITGLKLVWYRQTDDGSFEETGHETVLWDGKGDSPITVTGPINDGELMTSYEYEAMLVLIPPDDESDAVKVVPAFTVTAADPYDGSVLVLPEEEDYYDPVRIDN